MESKVAIITGSEGGIGSSIVRRLREENFSIFGLDLVPALTPNIYTEYFQASVDDLETVSLCFEKLQNYNFNYLVLVNNAGVTIPNNNSMVAWNKTISINLTGPFIWMQKCANYFEEKRISGAIISITSLAAELSFPGNPSYAASKGGLKQLTKSFAYRLGPLGIRCNNIIPGYIETKLNEQSMINEVRYQTRSAHSLLQRWGRPEEVAETVSFLASDKSTFITGADYAVDGGWLARGIIE